MNETLNDGGQAFPGPCDATKSGAPIYPENGGGMSLRDYFAAKAMQANATNKDGPDRFTLRAEWAYMQADAMIKARDA